MKYAILLLTLFLLACEKPHPNVEENIAILQGDIPEEDTSASGTDCVFDTSYYAFAMKALHEIPGVREISWVDSMHTAKATWKGHSIERVRGGCIHFVDNLVVVYNDTTSLENTRYWLGKALEAATQFSLPNYPAAIRSGAVELDPARSDRYLKHFQVNALGMQTNEVLEGIILIKLDNVTRMTLRQYIN